MHTLRRVKISSVISQGCARLLRNPLCPLCYPLAIVQLRQLGRPYSRSPVAELREEIAPLVLVTEVRTVAGDDLPMSPC